MRLRRDLAFTLIELMIVIAIIAIIAAIAIPNLIEARKAGNEAAAIGALKTIGTAQNLFREGDKDGDTEMDYGTLEELEIANLIDTVLGGGTKQGYTFGSIYNATTPDYLWVATANPAVMNTTGDRSFMTNHAGVIYYTTNVVAGVEAATSTPSAGMQPVGK